MKNLDELAKATEIPLRDFQRVLEVGSKVIWHVVTVKEAREACSHTFRKSNEEWSAIEKWFSLCSTAEEAREAYHYVRGYFCNGAEREILEKWNAFSLAEAEKASTFEEAMGAYENAPEKSEAERIALIKMWEIYKES